MIRLSHFGALRLALLTAAGCSEGAGVVATIPVPGQPSAVPPVSREALQNEGRVVSTYDGATDHTTTAFLARVDAPEGLGLHLYAYFVHPGAKPTTQVSDVYLGVVSLSSAGPLESTRELSLTADEATRLFACSYGVTPAGSSRYAELLLINNTFPREEALELAQSTLVEVDIKAVSRFSLAALHMTLLRELVARMSP